MFLQGVAMSYLTINSEGNSEYIEKRSKFLGVAVPCQTEQQAFSILEDIKKKHWDARHNCYAFIVDDGLTTRFSDDSEPHGTAGKPILEVISAKGLRNVLVIVTRYFGGVLLGTGGLVRAYTKAAKDALENAKVVEMVPCTLAQIKCDYSAHSSLLRLLENSKAVLQNTDFAENITLTFSIKDEDIPVFNKNLIENFAGKLNMIEIEKTISPFEI